MQPPPPASRPPRGPPSLSHMAEALPGLCTGTLTPAPEPAVPRPAVRDPGAQAARSVFGNPSWGAVAESVSGLLSAWFVSLGCGRGYAAGECVSPLPWPLGNSEPGHSPLLARRLPRAPPKADLTSLWLLSVVAQWSAVPFPSGEFPVLWGTPELVKARASLQAWSWASVRA